MNISIKILYLIVAWEYSMSEPTLSEWICEILLFILEHVVERA